MNNAKNPTRRTHTLFLFIFTFLSNSFAIAITGTILNQAGDPIAYVNIYAGNSGTTSNENGDFHLEVMEGQLVTISHIGYTEIQIKSKSKMGEIILTSTNLTGKDVIVNSSLTKRDLYNTPSSVTLFNSKQLTDGTDFHFQGLIERIPNLNYSRGTSRPRYFQIRGIGERSHYAGEGPPNYSVGFIVDGIDFSGIGMAGHLFDVSQVEVFRGPQSTVFGPNAIAGSINITTQNPTPFNTGIVETYLSSDNGRTISAAFGGPIMESLSFRMAGTKHSQNGFRKNNFQNKENTNGKAETILRTKLLFNPMDNLNIRFTYLSANLDNKYDAWSPDNNEELITYTNHQGKDSQKSNAFGMVVNFPEFLGFTTEYKYSNLNSDLVHSYDGDWGNDSLWLYEYGFDPAIEGWKYEFWDETNRNKVANTNELIFTSNKNLILPFNGSMTAGLYTSNMNQTDDAIGWLFGGDATSLTSKYVINNTAVYGNYNSKLSSALEFDFNLRFENHQMDYHANAENFHNSYYYMDINLPEVDTTKSDQFFGGNFSIQQNINENVLLYGSIAKGYKAGGINQNPYLTDESRFYNPEFNLNTEVGVRIIWKNIHTNIALFKMERTNQQVQISSQQVENDPNSFTYYTSNSTEGFNYGFEFEPSIKLSEDLIISSSFGYLNTHINEFIYEDNVDSNIIFVSAGNRAQAMAPKFNSSFDILYFHNSGIFINGNISFKDEYYFSDSHDQKSKPYTLLNFDLGYRLTKTSITFWIKNLTDKRYAVRGFYFGLEPPDYEDKLYLSYGNPRQMGVKINYRF